MYVPDMDKALRISVAQSPVHWVPWISKYPITEDTTVAINGHKNNRDREKLAKRRL
jgi:hypothetical protein